MRFSSGEVFGATEITKKYTKAVSEAWTFLHTTGWRRLEWEGEAMPFEEWYELVDLAHLFVHGEIPNAHAAKQFWNRVWMRGLLEIKRRLDAMTPERFAASIRGHERSEMPLKQAFNEWLKCHDFGQYLAAHFFRSGPYAECWSQHFEGEERIRAAEEVTQITVRYELLRDRAFPDWHVRRDIPNFTHRAAFIRFPGDFEANEMYYAKVATKINRALKEGHRS